MICTKRSGVQGSPCSRTEVPEPRVEVTLRPGSSAAEGHQPVFGIEVGTGQSVLAEEPALHAAVKLADDGITGRKPDRSGEAEPHTTADYPLRGKASPLPLTSRRRSLTSLDGPVGAFARPHNCGWPSEPSRAQSDRATR